jgi:hypothetical protein
MFRRINLLYPGGSLTMPDGTAERIPSAVRGLMGPGLDERVYDAWMDSLRGPAHSIPRNAKFYFTERGWRRIGCKVVEACQQAGHEYRVIRIKECEVDVVWRDSHYDLEVAAQPRKKRRARFLEPDV